ncbi:MAG: ribosomal protein S18-alanine N-acetyltransferase [Alphaproteobacteria bacterium]
MTQINVRIVGKEAAELLSDVHTQCFPHYWDKDAFNDFFSVAGTMALLAEADKVVGMLVYRISHEQADIITIAVLPEFRRKGIARLLMDKALQALQGQGVETLFLDVEYGNQPAISLYEALGFSHQRRRRQYYRQTDGTCTDALVMTKKVTSC